MAPEIDSSKSIGQQLINVLPLRHNDMICHEKLVGSVFIF